MRIAVASEGLDVAPNFGTCSSFTFYTVDRGIIVECQNMPNPGLPGPQIAPLLLDLDVRVLIVFAIDFDTATAFCDADIEVVAKASGSARAVAEAYLSRTLSGTDDLCHTQWDFEDSPDCNLAEA